MDDKLSYLKRLAHIEGENDGINGAKDPLNGFWNEFNAIEDEIRNVDNELNDILELIDEASNDNTQIQRKLAKVGNDSGVVKKKLDLLTNQTQELAQKAPGTAETRIQQNHLHILAGDFSRLVKRITEAQENNRRRLATQIVRQCSINGVDLEQEDIDRLMECPEVLQQNAFVVGGSLTKEALDLHRMISKRHKDILEIDQALTDMLDLYLSFALIVEDQGIKIDNIERNISDAADYVTDGVEDLIAAHANQKSKKKCLIWVLVIGFVVITGIVLLIVFV